MSATSAIHIAALTKSFGEVDVLRGVDLDIGGGTIVALLGSNGAGKPTLVRILSTLLHRGFRRCVRAGVRWRAGS